MILDFRNTNLVGGCWVGIFDFVSSYGNFALREGVLPLRRRSAFPSRQTLTHGSDAESFGELVVCLAERALKRTKVQASGLHKAGSSRVRFETFYICKLSIGVGERCVLSGVRTRTRTLVCL